MKKLTLVTALTTAVVCLSASVTVFAVGYGVYPDDGYTVETETFKYWTENDTTYGNYGMRLETLDNSIDFKTSDVVTEGVYYMVAGVFYQNDMPYSYVLSPINTTWTDRTDVLHEYIVPFLKENQILQLGDILRAPLAALESDELILSTDADVEFAGNGVDFFGDEFIKVIRHELITKSNFGTLTPNMTGITTIKGDATEDEDVNIVDVIAVNKNILGKEKMSAYAQYVSDVNQNGTVDSGDSLEILKYVVGLNETL